MSDEERKKLNAARWLAEVRRRLAAGLCRDCRVPVTTGRSMCPKCLMRHAAQRRSARQKKRESGICLRCSVPAAEGDYLCAGHRASDTEYQKAYRKSRRQKAEAVSTTDPAADRSGPATAAA